MSEIPNSDILQLKLELFHLAINNYLYWFLAIIVVDFAMVYSIMNYVPYRLAEEGNCKLVAVLKTLPFVLAGLLALSFIGTGICFNRQFYSYLVSIDTEVKELLLVSGQSKRHFSTEFDIAILASKTIHFSFWILASILFLVLIYKTFFVYRVFITARSELP